MFLLFPSDSKQWKISTSTRSPIVMYLYGAPDPQLKQAAAMHFLQHLELG